MEKVDYSKQKGNPAIGTEWRDYAGHRLIITRTRVAADGTIEMVGDTIHCPGTETCGNWWAEVHRNKTKFPEYHNEPRVFGTPEEVESGEVFGWERFDASVCGAKNPQNEDGRMWCNLPENHEVLVAPSGATYVHAKVFTPNPVDQEHDIDGHIFGW